MPECEEKGGANMVYLPDHEKNARLRGLEEALSTLIDGISDEERVRVQVLIHGLADGLAVILGCQAEDALAEHARVRVLERENAELRAEARKREALYAAMLVRVEACNAEFEEEFTGAFRIPALPPHPAPGLGPR
jgi:hypothetical protein